MPLTIPDETLNELGLSDREVLLEIACHLFDVGRLDLWPAARLAGLGRAEFEAELRARNIAVYRPTVQDLRDDLETLRKLGV